MRIEEADQKIDNKEGIKIKGQDILTIKERHIRTPNLK